MKVELLSHTQDPFNTIIAAVRNCYASKADFGERDQALIRRVIERGHESTVEHVCFTFRVSEISRACSHQLVRHRIASYSQRSQRYVKEHGFNYVIPQTIAKNLEAASLYHKHMREIQELYARLKDEFKVPAEDARMVLPNACHTEIVITMNVRALRNFFKLRLDRHAQWEIRELAGRMFDLVFQVLPVCFEDLKPLRGAAVAPDEAPGPGKAEYQQE